MRILIADDHADTRLLLSRFLKKWGHEVMVAKDGDEAWEILQKLPINFVISDWIMPNMDGLELCKRIRAANFRRYIYIILLTAKNAKEELVAGMEAGADDFMVKPFNKGELKVRIRAGERILKLEKDLDERNQKLREAYEVIRKDLQAAAELQKSFLPDATASLNGIKFEWLFLPCTFVAGDIFNFFALDEKNVGFYLLDVAGHGIPAAMLSVTISKILTSTTLINKSLQPQKTPNPDHKLFSPATLIDKLNKQFQTEKDAMRYFTMNYGIIDTETSKITFCQAGHPPPIYLNDEAGISLIGKGGFPVGMLPEIEYEEFEIDFKQGDRLILYSDGITECTNKFKQPYSINQLMQCVDEYKDLPLQKFVDCLGQSLRVWRGSEDFDDDVTLIAIEGNTPKSHFKNNFESNK